MRQLTTRNEPVVLPRMEETVSGYRVLKASILALPIFCASVACALAQQAPASEAAKNLKPVTNEMLRNPPAADWLMWRRTYDGYGYSPLDQINKDNVKNLKPAWSWSMNPGATETTPIVHDGVLFLNHNGDKIQALDGATGDLIWEYKRDLPAKLLSENSNQLTKRNMAIYGDNLYIATSDAHIVALDAKTGKVVWDHTVADWTKGWRYSGGPFIVNDTLVQGMTGCGHATRLLHHRARREDRRGEMARSYHRASGRSELRYLERHPARKPLWRLGLDFRQLRSRAGSRLLRHWAALSVDRGDERAAAEEAGRQEQRALHRLDARHRTQDRQSEMVSPASRDRHLGSRLRLRAHADRPAGQRRDPQGAGHHRQARDHRGDRPHQRRVALAQGDDPAKRRHLDRPQDRREDDQSSVGAAYRSDHGELPCRSRRPWLAGDGVQSEYRDLVPAAERVLLEHHAEPARSRPGLYRRRPRHFCANAGPQQRRQYRPRRRRQAGGSLDGLDRPNPHAADWRSSSDRRRRRVRRRVGPLVPRLRRRHRQGAVGDQIEQCAQFVP